MRIRPMLVLTATGLLLGLAQAAWAQSPAAGTIRVALNSDIRSTNPGVNRDANTDTVLLHVVEGLVAFTENGGVGPLLAESIALSDDGKTYTFTLRQGVRFHNGAPLTADDVVWTWRRYLDPATRWRCLSEFDGRGFMKITSVEAKDPRTVVFRLDRPSALFLGMMARADCGGSGILHRDSVGADGSWKAPIGTGPFTLGEWRKGEYVELVRFPGYVSRPGPRDGLTGGKTALVEKVRFVVIPDGSAAKAALLNGSIDVLPDLETNLLADLKGRTDVTTEIAHTMGLNAILFQTKDPLIGDVRIRQAIALAIDTAEIVGVVTQGLARPNNSPIPVSSPYYSAVQSRRITRDLARAKQLLAEAGYRGQPIKLIANKRYSSTFDAAVLVQAMAREAGIAIDIEVLEWATQLDRYGKGDYQMMSFPYSARLDPSLSFEMVMGPKATQPRKVWDNPEAQALLAESMAVSDQARRQAILDDLYRRFLDDMPMIVLYNGLQIAAWRTGVTGYAPFPMGVSRLWGVSKR
ncbi:MAG TPA: ABC transporter substrate-binding protein [Thermodesulfobacteriota bacterium]